MGAYVNPKGETKETFLTREGRKISCKRAIAHEPGSEGCYAVCLIDNGLFTAAGIMFNKREVEDFTSPSDYRNKEFYLVSKEKLLSASNLEIYVRK